MGLRGCEVGGWRTCLWGFCWGMMMMDRWVRDDEGEVAERKLGERVRRFLRSIES